MLYNSTSKISISESGGKGFHLAMMKSQGFPVPDFWILSATHVEQIIQSLRPQIETILETWDTVDAEQQHLISQQIKQWILQLALPADLEQAIASLPNKISAWAIRSSAIDEDQEQQSFAGQHDTKLYVDKSDLWSAISEVIASAWNPHALAYRKEQQLSIKQIKIAVVLQQMIDAKVSGIAFSMNIQANLADSLVVAAYGLGEGIVSDQVVSDQYLLSREHQDFRSIIAKKEEAYTFNKKGGLALRPVDADLQEKAALSQKELLEVVSFAKKAEKLLQTAADIEFSFDQEGFKILQMRAISTLNFNKIKILDNTNIVESYPGISLPLTYDFANAAYQRVFYGSSKAFAVPEKSMKANSEVFKQLIAHPYGRIYYRLDNWYRMMALITSSRKSLKYWEDAVGLKDKDAHLVKVKFKDKWRNRWAMLRLILSFPSAGKRFFKAFDLNFQFLQGVKDNHNSSQELWINFQKGIDHLFQPWYLTIVNDFVAFKSFAWLQNLIKKWKISSEDSFANNLLCGLGEIESEKAVLKTLEFKMQIEASPQLRALFKKNIDQILQAFTENTHPQFFQKIHKHFELYGDRSLAELKLETPSLRQDPKPYFELLKAQLNSDLVVDSFLENQKNIRTEAWDIVHKKLRYRPIKKLLFKKIFSWAALGLQNRENMRFCRSRAYGAVKEIFYEMGELLVKAKALTEAKDVFYLDTTDLEQFCLNKQTKGISEKVAERKIAFNKYRQIKIPDRISYMGEDLPNFDLHLNIKNDSSSTLRGQAASKGIIEAEAVVLEEARWDIDVRGKILVSKMTDPGWVFLMTQAVGLISEKGSLLSHTAIVGRELGIPVVVGVHNALQHIKTGDRLKLDANQGLIEILS